MANHTERVRCVSPMLEIGQAAEEAGGHELRSCYQCGTCSAVCPWGNLVSFSPRRFIGMARLGLEGFEEDTWTCVSCRQCKDRCPQQIDIPEVFQSVRNLLLQGGSTPASLSRTLASLACDCNPWGEPQEKKTVWADAHGIPRATAESEAVLFPCCTNELDPRNQKDFGAVASLLGRGGVRYGYIGNAGSCCGDQTWSIGHQELFDKLQGKNQTAMKGMGKTHLLTISPHCLHAFRNRYDHSSGLTATHVVELYRDLVREGRLKPVRPFKGRVTYHDPCYLGRYFQIYDAPREVLSAIPELELVEMAHNRERSLCCGGGGGGVWMERPKGERLSDVRVMEAVQTGASVIAVACPYCVQMLESSVMALGLEDRLQVRTVSELLLGSMAEGGQG
ncbi:MAG: (Fe-S)-binding protein [Deltaproteobacteria bacterium]|nr:(Fe-S)-binding protein [Deltaproteobacteria bacterium]